jgi:AcrR family transcriptional regulator
MPTDTSDEAALFESLAAPKARELAAAGVECFAEKGFYGTTTRDIAERVGLSPAAVYVHFRSKADLLYTISRIGHEGALLPLEEAARHDDPVDRLRAMVAGFASWHARNHRLAKVVQYELHALPDERQEEIRAMRRRFGETFEAAIEEGAGSHTPEGPDPAGATLAILSLCIDVARWYSPGGRLSPNELGELYADLMLGMLGGARKRVEIRADR